MECACGRRLVEPRCRLMGARIPAPGNLIHRPAGLIAPLPKEPGQRDTGLGLHCLLKVFGRGVSFGIEVVIPAYPFEKRVVTQYPPEHVQNPRALLVIECVKLLRRLSKFGIDQSHGARAVISLDAFSRLRHCAFHRPGPLKMLLEEIREIGCESLAEPQTITVRSRCV